MDDADRDLTARRWDEEYRGGRYRAEPPLRWVPTILDQLKRRAGATGRGLYVGCGNGRNYLPLLDAGLDLCGLDVSPEALAQLAARRPLPPGRLVCADFLAFDPAERFDYVIALQVFQHGTAADAARYLARVAVLLRPRGLFFLRVNSASTDVYHAHDIVERSDGGFTARYLEGPKRGLDVHFYGREELDRLTAPGFRCVAAPREDVTVRTAPKTGSWAQWQAIYERR